jgi:transketolase
MRNAFAKALIEAARSDPRLVLLTGDHGYALFDEFRKILTDRYINAGVAEQNMVGVAAGLAKGGFRPVVYGLSSFIPVRVLEQIKLDVAYESLPVVFVGDGAGVVYSHLGSSHQSTEDIAALRAIPNLAILSPCDEHEMPACLNLSLQHQGPVYLRMGKADLGPIHVTEPELTWGHWLQIREGTGDLAWIATGSMVRTALEVSRRWVRSAVWSAPFIKPIKSEQVIHICRRHRAIIVLEEHSVLGGLGSAVAEIASSEWPAWICRIGIADRFSRFCGSYQFLMKEHDLAEEAVATRVLDFLDKAQIKTSETRGTSLAA